MIEVPGAVAGEDGTVAHYGNPAREYRELVAGRGFTELALDAVVVTGPDRLRWLHSMASQSLEGLRPGESTEGLIFDPAGHVQNAFFVYDDGAATHLLTDAGMGGDLRDFLDSMRFMLRVEVELRPVEAIGFFGELPCASTFVWRDPWPEVGQGSATYSADTEPHPAAGWRRAIAVVPSAQEAADSLIASGWIPAGTIAWESARIEGWRPRPADALQRVLPHELDWLRTAVHLSKGCYRGQETVAKLVNLGRTPRRLVELYLEGPVDELPVPGDPVFLGEREAGKVLSAVRHPEDGPVALAVVRRPVPTDAALTVGNFSSGQRVIVDPSGKSSVSPESRPGAGFKDLRHVTNI